MGEISYVAQDNFLFDKSIRENIRMGNPDASDEEVEAAAKAANCHDFIMQLEQGYDTMAGDAGARLSGGERQRITIARAMLKQASVIILDEATAYADPENEALIQQAISKLVVGKSLIVVAHRLNTIRNADQILVVANGEIVGRGIQEELLQSCPFTERCGRTTQALRKEAQKMFEMICRVFKIAGNSRRKIVAGIVCNILEILLQRFYDVRCILDSAPSGWTLPGHHRAGFWRNSGQCAGPLLFQWMYDRTMSGSGYDIFRDYRLEIGERLEAGAHGIFLRTKSGHHSGHAHHHDC